MTELSCMEGSYVQRVYQKRVTYSSEFTQMSFSFHRYLKPKDIQYIVYSTGKLHK